MHAKDYRPRGQEQNWAKTQYMGPRDGGFVYMLGDLPRIPGQMPKIADVLRTTPEEKGLTVGQPR